ncbi:MAG: putative Ig-like domain protein [Myxococcaceae bacterium]|nr:putative Ig-like domain protein [Myxococcaceae bacterium]
MHTKFFSGRHAGWLVLFGAFLGCSSDGGGSGSGTAAPRASVLSFSAGQIAQAALGDTPNQDFVDARVRVQKRVSTDRVQYARSYTLGTGRMPITSDTTFGQVRLDAASALGTSIDPAKAADPSNAGPALDALFAQIIALVPAATSCAGLPAPKDEACAFALIMIDVLRSEAPLADAGALLPSADAGTPDGHVDGGGATGPVTLFSCPTRDLAGAMTVMGTTITTSQTWSGKVLIKGTVYLTSGTLTIMPGTQVFMDVDSRLEIGWNSSAPTLIADATVAAPILFCGVSGDKGYWDSVVMGTKLTTNSVLRNVLFSDGGGTDKALELQGVLTVDNVQVRNALKDGIWADDFKADSKVLSVEGAGGTAVVITGEDALTHFPLGGTLINNVANEAVLRFDHFANSTVVHNIGVPYVQEGDLLQYSGDLTFEPGVDYRFKPDASLELGWNSASAGVHLNGTAAAHVKFGPWKGVTARWAGLSIDSKVTTNSNVSYVDISQAGSTNKPALQVSAPILLDTVTLTDNLVGASLIVAPAAGSKNLTITKTRGRPLTVTPDALFGIPAGGTYTGNDIDQIAVNGDNFAAGNGTISDLGVPYFVQTSIDQYDGSNIVIAAGTDFVMNTDVLLTIGWNSGKSSLIAKGTAAAPITFSGLAPTAGSWAGIVVDGAVLSTTAFDYVQISHAGAAGKAALELKAPNPPSNPPVAVTHSTFTLSAGYGILHATAVTSPDYSVTNTFVSCSAGAVGAE